MSELIASLSLLTRLLNSPLGEAAFGPSLARIIRSVLAYAKATIVMLLVAVIGLPLGLIEGGPWWTISETGLFCAAIFAFVAGLRLRLVKRSGIFEKLAIPLGDASADVAATSLADAEADLANLDIAALLSGFGLPPSVTDDLTAAVEAARATDAAPARPARGRARRAGR